MKVRDEVYLHSEIQTLQRFLDELPAEEELERLSFIHRLELVKEELAILQQNQNKKPARAKLTFRGKPVVGIHGIFADFGLTAAKAFTDTISTVAASITGVLNSSMGPVPNKEQNQLLIIGSVIGSFGFELEEVTQEETLYDNQSPVSQALDKTVGIFLATQNSDEELADALSGLQQRAITSIKNFLDCCLAADATCGIETERAMFRFKDIEQQKESSNRLSIDNIRENVRFLKGSFVGILPNKRQFEFLLEESKEVISGKISIEIHTPEKLNDDLHQQKTIQVIETRVGSGRPRYILNKIP